VNDVLRSIQLQLEHAEARIAKLEGLIGKGTDDMYLVDKINYHLGRVSGLRFALVAIANAEGVKL
jgi:hypothetical protein